MAQRMRKTNLVDQTVITKIPAEYTGFITKHFSPLDDSNGIKMHREFEFVNNLSPDVYLKTKEGIVTHENYESLKHRFIFDDEKRSFVYVLVETPMSKLEDLDEEERWFHSLCSREEIKRIFKPENGEDFLLKIRAEQVRDDIRLFRVFLFMKKKAGDGWSFTNSFHEDYFEDYLSWLSEAERKSCDELVHGFFETREANGHCYVSPFGNIVLISYGLKHFLFYMNLYLFGESMAITTDDRMHALFIACRIMLDIESHDFLIDPRGSLPKNIEQALNDLVNWQLLFVAGHEFAHHYLGHMHKSKMRFSHSAKEKHHYLNHLYSYSENDELEADFNAVTAPKHGPEWTQDELAKGAIHFFLALDIYEHIEHHYFPPSSGFRSHPPPRARIYKLRERLDQSIGYKEEELRKYIEVNDNFKKYLTDEYLPFFPETFETYGSIYLPSYKPKLLMDRLDF